MSAIIKGTARQSSSVQSVSEGAEVYARLLRDGSFVGAGWKLAGVMRGLGFMINVGAFSTPIVGGGNGTAIDQDQPEFMITVPDNTSILPIRVEIVVQPGAFAAEANETEIVLAVDQDAVGTPSATSSEYTSETIYNMNTLVSNSSTCTATSAHSGNNTTAPVLDLELMHRVIVADADGTEANFVWNTLVGLYEPEAPVIINGPAHLVGYWGGTVAANAFASVQWIELPTSALEL